MKNHSKVNFQFESQGDLTKVTWNMQGSLPIFMFFMKKMMICMISCDYDRGLKMLKEWSETGHVHSKTEIKEVLSKEAFTVLGVTGSCKIEEIEKDMEKAVAFVLS